MSMNSIVDFIYISIDFICISYTILILCCFIYKELIKNRKAILFNIAVRGIVCMMFLYGIHKILCFFNL